MGDLTKLYRVDVAAQTSTERGTGFTLNNDSGGTPWDVSSGGTTWDGGTTVWDAGVVKASQWSIISYGSFVLATSGTDAPQIKKDNGDFVSLVAGSVTLFQVGSGGSGYAVDDVLTLTGALSGSGATATVLAVSSGVITEVGMKTAGTNYVTGETVTVSGGGGSLATGTITVSDMDVDTVEIFVKRGPHILGFNTSVSDREFIWTDADDTDDWVTSTTNLAGQLEIRELQTAIVAAVPLGDRIAVYGADQMFLVNYLANQLVFGYQPALNGVGAVSKKSVVAVGRKNYGLSTQGFFVTDGVTADYIDQPAIRNYYESTSAGSQISKTVGYHDEENNQIRWYWPTDSSAITQGVSYNYRRGTWSIVLGARSAGDERRILASPVTGTEDGRLLKEGVGQNEGTSAMTAFVRSKPMELGTADLVKELNSIRIGFVGQGLQYRIGWSETEDGTINWGAYADMSTGFDFQNIRTAGRWLLIELRSATLNAEWEVMNIEFIGRAEGVR